MAQFVLTTTETEPNYYHQKSNIQFASGVAEPMIITQGLKNKRNIEIVRNSWIYRSVLSRKVTMKSLAFAAELCRNSVLKYSFEKAVIINFVSFFTIFCQIFCRFAPIYLTVVLICNKNRVLGNNVFLFSYLIKI